MDALVSLREKYRAPEGLVSLRKYLEYFVQILMTIKTLWWNEDLRVGNGSLEEIWTLDTIHIFIGM
jgi:hypothetical protein